MFITHTYLIGNVNFDHTSIATLGNKCLLYGMGLCTGVKLSCELIVLRDTKQNQMKSSRSI